MKGSRRRFIGEAALAAAASLVLSLGARAEPEERYDLRYRFEDGARSAYDLNVELEIATTAAQGGLELESSTKTTVGLVMDVVEHATKEGGEVRNTLGVTFRDLTLTQELSGPGGDHTVTVGDGEVVVKRYGTVLIDTKEGKGKDLAKGVLKEFAFLGEEGTLAIDANGRVGEVEGPPAFKSFIAADTGAGLWVLETKGERVRVGETWRSKERTIRGFRGLDLSANPLTVKLSYTLEEVTEREGRQVAKIAVKSGMRRADLSGMVSKEALRNARVTLPKLKRTIEGTILFDIERGRVIESDVKVTLEVDIEMKVKDKKTRGRPKPGEEEESDTMTMRVSASASVRTSLRPPEEVEDVEEVEEKAEEKPGEEALPEDAEKKAEDGAEKEPKAEGD